MSVLRRLWVRSCSVCRRPLRLFRQCPHWRWSVLPVSGSGPNPPGLGGGVVIYPPERYQVIARTMRRLISWRGCPSGLRRASEGLNPRPVTYAVHMASPVLSATVVQLRLVHGAYVHG